MNIQKIKNKEKFMININKKIFAKIIFIVLILIFYLNSTNSIAIENQNEINSESKLQEDINSELSEQEENFGINSFLVNSKKYTGDFFDDIDIKDILNSAIKGEIDNKSIAAKIFKKLGKEVQLGAKSLAGILAIIIIHSILKAISDGLENNSISRLIYFAQYIAIVVIIMNNFSSTINLVRETTENLVGFINTLIPLLISLMVYTGSVATTTVLEPVILFMINFIGNLIQGVLIPVILIIVAISIISKISDQIQISKISKFLKSSAVWFLGIILTIFVGIVSLEGSLTNSVDGITAKTAKAIVSSTVPIVGKILGDAVESVLGCGIILKNAVGFVGIIIILGICIMPILKVAVLAVSYKLMASITQVIADEKIVSLLDEIGDIFKILLAILVSISFMVIIGVAVLIKMTNI